MASAQMLWKGPGGERWEKVGVTGAGSVSQASAHTPNCGLRPSFCSPRLRHQPFQDQAMAVTIPHPLFLGCGEAQHARSWFRRPTG